MLFSEKLYQLRKERNLSQEALAEKLGTTRQAVSKWENGQGFPETEKLLLMSNLFEVSVDSLLKDTPDEIASNEKGYYVSKEMAEGYLANQRRWLRRFVFGGGVLILSITAFLKFEYEGLTPLVMLAMLLPGGFCALQGLVCADRQYRVLEKEPLIFDGRYLSELKLTEERLSRRLTPLFVVSFVGMMLSIFALSVDVAPLQKDFSLDVPLHVEVAVAALALSASLMFYSGTILESYQLLAKNEEHVQGFWFRLLRKAKRTTDALLK